MRALRLSGDSDAAVTVRGPSPNGVANKAKTADPAYSPALGERPGLDLPIDHFRLLGVSPTTDGTTVLRTLQQRLDRSPDQGFTLDLARVDRSSSQNPHHRIIKENQSLSK